MAFFRRWIVDVIQDFQELEEMFVLETLNFVIMVGRRQPMAFAVYFLLLVDRGTACPPSLTRLITFM